MYKSFIVLILTALIMVSCETKKEKKVVEVKTTYKLVGELTDYYESQIYLTQLWVT